MTMMDDYDCNFRGNAPLACNYSREMKRSVCACDLPHWCLDKIDPFVAKRSSEKNFSDSLNFSNFPSFPNYLEFLIFQIFHVIF